MVNPQENRKVIPNPYRFLKPFGPEDAEIFRGREREIKAVLNYVLAARVTVLYAPSGAGKTSLINAGLVPRLKEEGFVPITVRPRPAARPDDPLEAIQDQIAEAIGRDTTTDRDLTILIRAAAERGGGPVLLICDQFEEIFIHFSDTPEQENLKLNCLKALGHLWSDRDLPVYMVFSLREDHVGNLIELKDYIPVIYANSVRLRPLDVESAREAIEEPAARYRTKYEHECLALMIKELAQGRWVEAAPLQIVCHRLWETCRPAAGEYTFTADDYRRKLGGAKKVIEQYLDDALRGLNRDEHDLAIEILAHLTRDKRRTARSAAELTSASSNPTVSARRVISVLEDRGLIRPQRWREELWYELTSEFAIEAISRATEALHRARERKHHRVKALRLAGMGIVLVVMLLVLSVGGMKLMAERQRSRDLFESRLTHAALLATNEDFAGALKAIRLGRDLAGVVSPTRRHALELLAWHAKLLGGNPDRRFSTYEGEVKTVAVSPDGHLVASAGEDRIISIRDFDMWNPVRELKGHEKTIHSLCFSSRGEWLASGDLAGTIRVWQVSDGKLLKTLPSEGEIWSVACSGDGRWLASGGRASQVNLWDTNTWKNQWTRSHADGVDGVAFSPDSRLLASASHDETVRIWDVESGDSLDVFRGHTGPVSFVVFSPDGERVASSGVDRSIRIWKLKSRKPEKILTGHKNMVFSLIYLDEGKYLASASRDRTIRIWELKTGETVRVLQGHEASVSRLAASRDGDSLISASNDGTVRVWSWRPPESVHTWDAGQGELYSVAIDPKEKWLVTGGGDGSLVVWSLPSREKLHDFKKPHTDGITRLAFSPNGRLLASASDDSTIKLWDATTFKELRKLKGHSDGVYSLAFSRDSQYLASAGLDGKIGLWEVETDTRSLVAGHEPDAYTVAFSPDGKLLASGGRDRQIILWQLKSGTPTRLRILSGHTNFVFSVTFSPDGQRLLSAGRDNVLRFWDVATGKRLNALLGHEDTVFGGVFSPDGGQIATVGADSTLRFWDAERGQHLLTLSLPAKMWDFAWSPSGRWLAIPLRDGNLRLHDLGDLYK